MPLFYINVKHINREKRNELPLVCSGHNRSFELFLKNWRALQLEACILAMQSANRANNYVEIINLIFF